MESETQVFTQRNIKTCNMAYIDIDIDTYTGLFIIEL